MSVIYFGTFLSIVTSNISSALFFPSASGIEIIPQKIFHSVQMYCFFLIIFIFKFQFGSIFKLIESFFNHAESTDEPIKGNLHLHCSIFVVQGFFFFFLMLFSQNVQSHQQTHHFSLLTLSIWLSTFPFFIILNIVILNSSSSNSNNCVLSGSSSNDYFVSSDGSLFAMPFSLT